MTIRHVGDVQQEREMHTDKNNEFTSVVGEHEYKKSSVNRYVVNSV